MQIGHHFPERIFLDSSVLQTIHDYGAAIWEGAHLLPDDRIFNVPGGCGEIAALESIFRVNERAMFEFALSENSFNEIAAKQDSSYLHWAYDVLDHWEACLADHGTAAFDGTGAVLAARFDGVSFNYLSKKDRLLIRDAVNFECDTFLTMERRLPRNAAHIQKETGLLIVRPTELWKLLQPRAGLFT